MPVENLPVVIHRLSKVDRALENPCPNLTCPVAKGANSTTVAISLGSGAVQSLDEVLQDLG